MVQRAALSQAPRNCSTALVLADDHGSRSPSASSRRAVTVAGEPLASTSLTRSGSFAAIVAESRRRPAA